jgi:hypothetical protein
MKKILIYVGAVTTILAASCTKNFDDINTNPTQASGENFDPNLLLPTAEVNYVSTIQGYSGAILFQSMWTQIFANAEYPTYYSNGDKYVASGNILTYAASIWNNAYQAASKAKEIQNLIVEKGMTAPNLGRRGSYSSIAESGACYRYVRRLSLIRRLYWQKPAISLFRFMISNQIFIRQC